MVLVLCIFLCVYTCFGYVSIIHCAFYNYIMTILVFFNFFLKLMFNLSFYPAHLIEEKDFLFILQTCGVFQLIYGIHRQF